MFLFKTVSNSSLCFTVNLEIQCSLQCIANIFVLILFKRSTLPYTNYICLLFLVIAYKVYTNISELLAVVLLFHSFISEITNLD